MKEYRCVNPSLRAIVIYLLNRKYIGLRHTPEGKLIKSKTKWINKNEKYFFEAEYKQLVNMQIILRLKKRTGKGSDWHISINPRKISEAYLLIEDMEE